MIDIIKILNNITILVTVVIIVLALLKTIDEKSKYDNLYTGNVKKMENKFLSKILSLQMLKKYHGLLEIRLKEMGKAHLSNFVFTSSMVFMIVSAIFMVLMKQYFLALFVPIILIKFFTYLLNLLAKDAVEEIEKTLPLAIDNIIRINSKYSDLRTILYEVSTNSPEPLASIFADMSRRMMTSPQDEVLMEFAEAYDNVWIYSFVLILISYMEDSNQEDTLKNLKNLRDMLERENFLMSKKISENRYGVAINYTVAGLGFLGFIINLTVNPYGKEFFFRTIPGLISFFIGMGALLFTIVVNIKLVHQKK